MKQGDNKEEAFKQLLLDHPAKLWSGRMYNIIDRYLTCKSIFTFDCRVNELRDLVEVTSLNNLGEILQGCRRHETHMIRFRKHDKEGRVLFGTTNRMQIMGDKLQESYDRHNFTELAA